MSEFRSQLADLKSRLEVIEDLQRVVEVLYWDQTTYMPPGGASLRGRQLATVTKLSHELASDAALGRLIDELEPQIKAQGGPQVEADLMRIARRDFERATRAPADLMGRLQEQQSTGYVAWQAAREANDFTVAADSLQRILELSREYANCFPGFDSIADPLIDEADQGMTVARVRPWFAQLRERLVPLVEAVCAAPGPDLSVILRPAPADAQLAFAESVAEQLGYDLARGRQDLTIHPFMVRFGHGDVRITTRLIDNDFTEALYSTMHEAGHALYEQGGSADLAGTPLAGGVSSGVHESQSRLWENLIGRSRGFWVHCLPQLKRAFPGVFDDVDVDGVYRAVNVVRRSPIRTESDELTYNLHVMIRFEIELDLLDGTLAVADLRDRWNADYESMLGITPESDRVGVLQDVHWYAGTIGGVFQGYTLGNVMSAQVFAAAERALPTLRGDIEGGRFGELLAWLTTNLYRHGRRIAPLDLIAQATGSPLSVEPYMDYLSAKYGALYGL